MKFGIKNLGPIKDANIELGELTILCGPNNMGKTYLTYSIYSFFETISANITFDINQKLISELISTGSCIINFEDLWLSFPCKLKNILPKYSRCIPRFLALQNKQETAEKIQFTVSEYDSWKERFYLGAFDNQNDPIAAGKDITIFISKMKSSYEINCSLENKSKIFLTEDKLSKVFIKEFSWYVMEKMLPLVFGLTGERSGIAIFGDFLNKIARVKDANEKYKENDTPSKHERSMELGYALPLRDEVNFLLNLKYYKNRTSALNNYKEILKNFFDLAGGQYSCENDNTICFIDNTSQEKYEITETSSSIKSLAELFFYIMHIASPGQILMIDEPEINLHPANQRKIARILAMLVNAGVHVFVTTHSDYIIRELNILIMLYQKEALQKKYKYRKKELLKPEQVKCYVMDRNTVTSMDISPKFGIEVTSFDDTIDQVNQIQQSILFGVE